MGKHDKHIEASSIEFLANKIARLEKENKDLRDEIVFKNDTISQLQKQCSRMSKWASEIEANAQDAVKKLTAEVEKWKKKALSLVDDYVQVS
jgi:predicted RNase H-like nuclease (RuvC/YqgF family)